MKDFHRQERDPTAREDLSYHVWEKSLVASCQEEATYALAAREVFLTVDKRACMGLVWPFHLHPCSLLDQKRALWI